MGKSNTSRIILDWPEERAAEDERYPRWCVPGSNICLDFHGDPARANLVVFSDGNHHMALRESLQRFLAQNPGVYDIFYATTPPGPVVNMLRSGGLRLGNLTISATPHLFISPPDVLDSLVAGGEMAGHVPFVRNQGNVLLVRKGNPKNIRGVVDLLRDDVRLFLSNPDTETASFTAYYETLRALAPDTETGRGFPDAKISKGQVVYGERIHHREAPQAVAEGSADAAMVFYHLALRYLRIFPEHFDAVPLGGSMDAPDPLPGNVTGVTHMGLVGEGGKWGMNLLEFLRSAQVMDIYRSHGLLSAEGSA